MIIITRRLLLRWQWPWLAPPTLRWTRPARLLQFTLVSYPAVTFRGAGEHSHENLHFLNGLLPLLHRVHSAVHRHVDAVVFPQTFAFLSLRRLLKKKPSPDVQKGVRKYVFRHTLNVSPVKPPLRGEMVRWAQPQTVRRGHVSSLAEHWHVPVRRSTFYKVSSSGRATCATTSLPCVYATASANQELCNISAPLSHRLLLVHSFHGLPIVLSLNTDMARVYIRIYRL